MQKTTETTDRPSITYFAESREQAAVTRREGATRGEFLAEKIGSAEVLQRLADTRSRVSIAVNTTELAEDGALRELYQSLAQSRVPADLWLTVPDEDGYWLHTGNVEQFRREIFKAMNIAERDHIPFSRIGVDLEFPLRTVFGSGLPAQIAEWFRQFPKRQGAKDATNSLGRMVEEVLASRNVDLYEIPFLADHAILRTALGIPQVPEISDPHLNRVVMTYSSVTPGWLKGEDFISRNAQREQRIPALGIVSDGALNPGRWGGIDPKKSPYGNPIAPLLDNGELTADITEALRVSPRAFYVFALNGPKVIENVEKALEVAQMVA